MQSQSVGWHRLIRNVVSLMDFPTMGPDVYRMFVSSTHNQSKQTKQQTNL